MVAPIEGIPGLGKACCRGLSGGSTLDPAEVKLPGYCGGPEMA